MKIQLLKQKWNLNSRAYFGLSTYMWVIYWSLNKLCVSMCVGACVFYIEDSFVAMTECKHCLSLWECSPRRRILEINRMIFFSLFNKWNLFI